ncbi:hypothetical protein BV22DRAFT_1048705 [Leucogyrophana mollusca]|uniref:Uncharacterized protein n=1 Tax=Leucogyrophana mollusca TaxID=85980 RepID=A0ACB8BB70_9AGAM|nr:hypothetical protein BV22DRAFT_1048705 [Leucogyrophana mollusca]
MLWRHAPKTDDDKAWKGPMNGKTTWDANSLGNHKSLIVTLRRGLWRKPKGRYMEYNISTHERRTQFGTELWQVTFYEERSLIRRWLPDCKWMPVRRPIRLLDASAIHSLKDKLIFASQGANLLESDDEWGLQMHGADEILRYAEVEMDDGRVNGGPLLRTLTPK